GLVAVRPGFSRASLALAGFLEPVERLFCRGARAVRAGGAVRVAVFPEIVAGRRIALRFAAGAFAEVFAGPFVSVPARVVVGTPVAVSAIASAIAPVAAPVVVSASIAVSAVISVVLAAMASAF